MKADCGNCKRMGRGCHHHPDSGGNTRGRKRVLGETEKITKRQTKALDLRIDGYTYRKIAAALDISVKTAYYDVQSALEQTVELRNERSEKLRELEEERLDELMQRLADSMRTSVECPHCEGRVDIPNVTAIGEARRVSESRRKLLGLDAPERHIHEMVERLEREVWPRWTEALRDIGVTDEQLEELADRLEEGTVH